MDMGQWPVLSLLILLPVVGAIVLQFLPRTQSRSMQPLGILAAVLPLLLAVWIYVFLNLEMSGALLEERFNLFRVPMLYDRATLTFTYHLAIDGLSLPLVLLTTVTGVIAALASVHVKKRQREFYGWLLIMESGLLGALLSRDIMLFLLFNEAAAVAVFMLLRTWATGERLQAARRYLVSSLISLILLLTAFLLLLMKAGPLTDGMRQIIFWLLLIGFGIRLPLVPLHTWFVHTIRQAPTPAAIMLTGACIQASSYGMIRFGLLLFPEEAGDASVWLAVAGAVQILYAAILAFVRTDVKQILSLVTVSQTGLVLLGLASMTHVGLEGAVMQLLAQGLAVPLLLLIMFSIQERTGTLDLDKLGGLARPMPYMSGMLVAGSLAVVGVPGLAGFIGHLLPLLAAYKVLQGWCILGVAGVLVAAFTIMKAVMSISGGPLTDAHAALKDARFSEALPMIILLALLLLLGIYPSITTDLLEHTFDRLSVGSETVEMLLQ